MQTCVATRAGELANIYLFTHDVLSHFKVLRVTNTNEERAA